MILFCFPDEKGNVKIAAWTTEVPHNVIVEEIKTKPGTLMATDWSGKAVEVISDDGKLLVEMKVFPQYITLPAGWE
jgi:hypothetical protein